MTEAATKSRGSKTPDAKDTPPEDKRRRAVRVRAGSLHAALKDVADVIEAKNTIPILANVVLSARDGTISLTATNLDMWAVRELASDDRDGPAAKEWVDSIRPFSTTLPGKALAQIVGEFDDDATVTIELRDDDPRAVISAGRSRFRLNCLPPEDFPAVPPVPVHACIDLPCSALCDAFAGVEHAISSEETRYYLNGIFVHPEGTDLRLAATDGHRLARLTLDSPEGAASFPPSIVGRRTVAVLDKLLHAAAKTTEGKDTTPAEVTIESASETPGALLRFSMPAPDGGTIDVVAKSIDGNFPDYGRVIPGQSDCEARIDREPLAAAIKRVSILVDSKSRAVKATFENDTLTLTVSTAELGEATEELPCSFDGGPFEIGFDNRYWRDALGAIATDQVVMKFTDAGGAALVLGEDGGDRLTQVLMPLRV